MRLVLLATAALLAACQPKAAEETAAAPPAEPAPAPAAEPPPQFVSSAVPFSAISEPAQKLTGNIRLTALSASGPNDTPSMKLESDKGVTYDTDLVPDGGKNACNIDWTGVFGEVVDPDDTTGSSAVLDIHKIALEGVPIDAPDAGYCGKEKTTYLAVAFPIGVMNGAHMGIAAFKSPEWPPKDNRQLCGVFKYRPN